MGVELTWFAFYFGSDIQREPPVKKNGEGVDNVRFVIGKTLRGELNLLPIMPDTRGSVPVLYVVDITTDRYDLQ